MRDCHSSDDGDVISINGKTFHLSYDKRRRRSVIHMISAFSTMNSLILGLIKRDEKSNEITAIPELLNIVDIKGKIITTDAMGCQKKIEVKLHWCLDVAMREDDCRIRRGNAAQLLSGIRHVAINILAENKGFKAGLMSKKSCDGERIPRVSPCEGRGFVILPCRVR